MQRMHRSEYQTYGLWWSTACTSTAYNTNTTTTDNVEVDSNLGRPTKTTSDKNPTKDSAAAPIVAVVALVVTTALAKEHPVNNGCAISKYSRPPMVSNLQLRFRNWNRF